MSTRTKESYNLEQVVKDWKGKMEYVNLGKSGLRVSKISLGMMSYGDKRWNDWVLEEDEALPVIGAAYEAGVNFFDNANMYSWRAAEEIFGKAFKQFNMKREEIVVSSKVFNPTGERGVKIMQYSWETLEKERRLTNQMSLSRKNIFDSVDASLKTMGLEYLDLLQIHRFDKSVPMEETMEALHDLIKMGKVRYIGATTMYAWQLCQMNAIAKERGWTQFICMQNWYSAIYREDERELVPYCKYAGISLVPHTTLSAGFLARAPGVDVGDTNRAIVNVKPKTDRDKLIAKEVYRVSQKLGIPMAQVALAWVYKNPGVAAQCIGIPNARCLDDALAAVHVKLSDEDYKAINDVYVPRTVLGNN